MKTDVLNLQDAHNIVTKDTLDLTNADSYIVANTATNIEISQRINATTVITSNHSVAEVINMFETAIYTFMNTDFKDLSEDNYNFQALISYGNGVLINAIVDSALTYMSVII